MKTTVAAVCSERIVASLWMKGPKIVDKGSTTSFTRTPHNALQPFTMAHKPSKPLITAQNKYGRSFLPHKSLLFFLGGVLVHPKPFISPINHSPLHSVPLKLGMLARKVCHEVRKTCFKPNMRNGPHKHRELVVDPNVHRDTHGDKN